MITLFRIIRLWQIKIKFKYQFWNFIYSQIIKLSENSEKIEKIFAEELVKAIHRTNENKTES